VRGRRRGRCPEDRIPNPFDILQDFVVPEAKESVAMLCEPSIAHRIAVAFGMLAAVKLDYESLLSAN
jgi:hypothetical protein